MDWLLGVFFSVLEVLDIRSSDPAIAAMKRARLQAILCCVTEIVCFVIAFTLRPDVAASQPVHAVQEWISLLFLAGAVCSALGIAWNAWHWWRAYSKPELYCN
jgi:hypothetical protein